jgi:CheY-like chemotaxis protein
MTDTILIVDDQLPMRELLKMTLAGVAEVVGECADGAEALAAYQKYLPDWVLMDWEMKLMDGLEATRRIIKSFPAAQILLVTQYNDKELRRAAHEAGACGFFVKDDLLDLTEFFNNRRGYLAP